MPTKRTRIILIIAFLPIFLCGTISWAATEDLKTLITEAIENNPAIKAEEGLWQAAKYRVKREYSLPDPEVSYTYFGESVETRVGPQQHKYGGKLKVPYPVKLYYRGKAQEKSAEKLQKEYEAAIMDVIKDVKFIFFELYWIDQAISLTEQEKSIVDGVARTAQTKYESNKAMQQDVIKLNIELARFDDKLLQLRNSRETAEARMRSVLGRKDGAPVGRVADVPAPGPEIALDDLISMAMEGRQELTAARIEKDRAEYEKNIAVAEYVPDVSIGFDYISVGSGYTSRPDDGKDAWMGTVSVNVPLWFDKLSAQVKEKKAMLEARRQEVSSMEDRVRYEVEDLYYRLNFYQDTIDLYRTALIPQAEQSLEVTRYGYETGTLNFIDWLDSERVLLQTKLAYYRAITDHAKTRAFLERVVGREF
ncbi:MAG: TolC family protein [Candidatus Omnitrophica bacterium]|nr:TolC family protein [Candidatus Omnitrophota bacterium]MDD5488607.1 TolC family protein [Candidatus Omnitrophota bacterium]